MTVVAHATKIQTEEAKGTSEGATSNSRFYDCDDRIPRIVRWHKPGPKILYPVSHGPKGCFNEFVASRLGEMIGAPVLRADVLYVPASVITTEDARAGSVPGFHCGVPKITGHDFVTKNLDGTFTYLPIDKIANADQLTPAAVLLAWLCIEDHAMDAGPERIPKWDNSVMLARCTENGVGVERYVLIDLENAFGTAEWNYDEQSPRALPDPMGVYVLPKHLRTHLDTLEQDARAKAFGMLGALNEADIRNCFNGYPEEWCGTAEREQAIEWTILRASLLGKWFKLNEHDCAVEINFDPKDRTAHYP